MPKVWLTDRWEVLIPALERLGVDQEAEIERLCVAEIAHWKDERHMILSSMKVPMTATRNRLEKIPLTPANTWVNPRTGKPEHIARRYMNFTEEEWRTINTISEEKLQERQENQQLIEHPGSIVARAEKLLESDRWYDLTAALALVTGRRLTEVLKTARFFPQTLYTVTFDGQLKKRQDVNVLPYEIPTLVPAEQAISAWRKLRSLVDTTGLDNDQVEQKYHKDASEAANRHFSGLIPQKTAKENLTTHAFRGVYAHIAVLWFCPLRVKDRNYVNAILGHWQAKDDQQKRQFMATEHYYDYEMSLDGQIDGRRGIRLEEPGIVEIAVFKQKAEVSMSTQTDEQETQGEPSTLETKPKKSRGTLTTKAGTFDIIVKLMHERGFLKHDEILVNLLEHDNAAHQMYDLLAPLGEALGANTPVAILRALIAAYHLGSSAPLPAGMSELLEVLASENLIAKVSDEVKVSSQEDPIGYLNALVTRDRKFKAGLEKRDSEEGIDFTAFKWEDLDGHKTKAPGAMRERFRRAVNSIMEHNRTTQDPLHRWFINAAIVRDLVGGRNDKVQEYLAIRAAEIKAHHTEYGLQVKQNNKAMEIKDEPDLVALLEAAPESR